MSVVCSEWSNDNRSGTAENFEIFSSPSPFLETEIIFFVLKGISYAYT